jgi:hypothetical protein
MPPETVASKEYSWEYVTADRCVQVGECELVYARLVPSASTTDSALYDGTGTSGKKITDLKVAVVTDLEFKPPIPIHCGTGIYVDIGTSVSGVLVVWRKL